MSFDLAVWYEPWPLTGAEAPGFASPRLGLPQLPIVDWPDDDDLQQSVALEDTPPRRVGRGTPVRLGR